MITLKNLDQLKEKYYLSNETKIYIDNLDSTKAMDVIGLSSDNCRSFDSIILTNNYELTKLKLCVHGNKNENIHFKKLILPEGE